MQKPLRLLLHLRLQALLLHLLLGHGSLPLHLWHLRVGPRTTRRCSTRWNPIQPLTVFKTANMILYSREGLLRLSSRGFLKMRLTLKIRPSSSSCIRCSPRCRSLRVSGRGHGAGAHCGVVSRARPPAPEQSEAHPFLLSNNSLFPSCNFHH